MDQTPYREAEQRLWRHYDRHPVERFVQLPALGVPVRVLELGAGEPTLFLHGSPTGGAGFAPLLPHLPGVRAIVVDRPNCGLSGTPARTSELAHRGITRLVPDVLDALELDRAHVVGSSLGGSVALHGAVSTPERIDRLVLLGAPAAVEGLPLPTLDRLLLLPGIARLASRFVPGRDGQRKAIAGIGHAAAVEDGRIPDAYWDWYDRLLHDTGSWRDEFASYGAFSRWSMSYGPEVEISVDDLSTIARPTQLVWGGRDSYGGPEAAEHMAAAMPDARLELMPEAGHLPWLDDPAAVGAMMDGFLRERRDQLATAA
jgi:pimeloyl-ACP methyl ester carboxylesterase